MLESKQATFKARLTSDTVSERLQDSLELGLLALKLVENCDQEYYKDYKWDKSEAFNHD